MSYAQFSERLRCRPKPDPRPLLDALQKIMERADEGAVYNQGSSASAKFATIARLAREALAKTRAS